MLESSKTNKPEAIIAAHSSSTDAILKESSKTSKPDAVIAAHSSSTDAALQKSNTLDKIVVTSKDVLDAEILWCLKVVTSHYSYKSCNDLGNFFIDVLWQYYSSMLEITDVLENSPVCLQYM